MLAWLGREKRQGGGGCAASGSNGRCSDGGEYRGARRQVPRRCAAMGRVGACRHSSARQRTSRRRKDGSERSAGSDVKARRSFAAKWRNVSDCRRVSDERIKCPLTDGFHRYFSPKSRTETKNL